ncbi:MAG: tyrosine--tRNA ligase [Alphaproteobacteria bacterium]|nr:tyrosine--tRNA ligase [Rickettsiales bacterium]
MVSKKSVKIAPPKLNRLNCTTGAGLESNTKTILPQSSFLQQFTNCQVYNNCNNFNGLDALAHKTPEKIISYIGFDLTADGLHVGHLSALMCVKRLISNGYKCIILLGGGTSYIGDPTGKNETRKILSTKQIQYNKKGVCDDILQILFPDLLVKQGVINLDAEIVFEDNNIIIVDNYFWLKNLNYIDFLREIGSYFSVNKLVKMDSMHSRLTQEQNLSFIEFNYPLLQAYDFYYLYNKYNCNCQIGGSDQWGNMLRGVELIEKTTKSKNAIPVFCVTIPLIVRSDGKKMGKSENGAIWLNSSKLDNASYWQYFRNIDDKDVDLFMQIFTVSKYSTLTDACVNIKNLLLTISSLDNSLDVREVKKSLSSINNLLHKEKNMTNLIFKTVSDYFEKISDDLKNNRFIKVLIDLKNIVIDLNKIINDIESGYINNVESGKFKKAFDDIENTGDNLKNTIGDLRKTFGKIKDGKFKKAFDDIENTGDNLKNTIGDLRKTFDDFEGIVNTDDNLKNTIGDLRKTFDDFEGIVKNFYQIIAKLENIGSTKAFTDVQDGQFKKTFDDFKKSLFNLCHNKTEEKNLDVNKKKELLATEATAICRGRKNADSTAKYVKNLFDGKTDENLAINIKSGTKIVDTLLQTGLITFKNEGYRVIKCKGVKMDNYLVEDKNFVVSFDNASSALQKKINNGTVILLSCGKKNRKTIKLIT